jgi:hypothetical protein
MNLKIMPALGGFSANDGLIDKEKYVTVGDDFSGIANRRFVKAY